MSQGQHLKLNKNTEDKIALFYCPLDGEHTTVDSAKGGVLMLKYIIEVVGGVFFCMLY